MSGRRAVGSVGSVAAPQVPLASALWPLVVGGLTWLADRGLPDEWHQAGSSYAVWSLTAYIVARSSAAALWPAARSGTMALVLLVAGYYVTALAWGSGASPLEVLFWSVTALVAGPGLGFLAWCRSRDGWSAAGGPAVLGAIFVAEAYERVGPSLARLGASRAPGIEVVVLSRAELVAALLWAVTGVIVTLVAAGSRWRRAALLLPVAAAALAGLLATVDSCRDLLT